jgi:broad specificity phosphatase PhoE
LSYLHLIRHAQAGPRHNYDSLSELGRRQAKLLGEHLFNQGSTISAIFSGTMNRHRQTAEIAIGELRERGSPLSGIKADERWNEFLLGDIYRHYLPGMTEEDAEFARDYQEMQRALEIDPHISHGATGRCDMATVRAWMGNRYPDYDGKSWCDFRDGIRCAIAGLPTLKREEHVLVFTSGGPIAVTVGAALDLPDEKILALMGVLYNCNVSSFRIVGSSLFLFSFNGIPHLRSPDLRTFR